ncbi:MAG: GSCFA domain-containing protein, partial [Parasphingopyxis sp.]
MPLVSLSGPQALATRKSNPVAHWGDRNLENRVEPVTKPAFDVPFRLEPGEAIFTIGSCFARNIEHELAQRGFKIPMRDLFKTDAFKGLDTEIVNNFGTPSIYNEIAWAFGEQQFDYDLGFCEVSPGKFVDLQMVPGIRAASLDLVRARREGLFRATREMARCRIVIMTLGLVELWWDEEAQLYLNSTPLPSVLRNAPERFSLHVLNFEECRDYLQSAFEVMFRHGHEDLRVILTVSPVPMMATHRRTDVISANCYSKSVLRAVAEHLVEADERITYFPSYETVTLSNRKAAWNDDLVHV